MINDYKEVKECIYKDEHYSVRDNGAVMRHLREGKKPRRDDGVWTFGVKNSQNGYMHIGSHRVHIIVATAFLGARDSKVYVVDHIDTNRCNNRVENLRWFTRLENVLNNEITRNKISYICGGIEKFIANPSILHERLGLFADPSLDWMRTVTREEAAVAYENIKRYWAEQVKNPKPLTGGKMNDGVYRKQQISNPDIPILSNEGEANTTVEGRSEFVLSNEEWERMTQSLRMPYPKNETIIVEKPSPVYIEEPQLVQAKSPAIAWQRRWKTPTEFICCPPEMGANPLEDYYNRLVIGTDYSSTLYYGNGTPNIQIIADKAYIEDKKSIIVFSITEASIKPYALSKIYVEDGKFIHESMGTFFEEQGVRKQFTLAQGQEWTGGDSIDDYC
ncbi:MAG: HNH endonuclease [Alistipes sp.]|nr:HNH endonuclease [Alistipes sp.]